MSNAWRYYEGTSSANTFIKDLAKVLSTAVKTEVVLDANGQVLRDREIIIDKNWDIVYPKPQRDQVNVMDWTALTPSEFAAKIENQLSQSNDTIILKTKTSSKDLSDAFQIDDIGIENDLNKEFVEMYVELYKPKYLADPEQYHPESEKMGIMPYTITRGIYQEYSNRTAERELNLRTISHPKNTTQYPMVTKTVAPVFYDGAYTEFKERIDSLAMALGTTYPVVKIATSGVPYSSTETITSKERLALLKGSKFLSTTADALAMSEDAILALDSLKITMEGYKNGGYSLYTLTLTSKITNETFTLSDGFEYQLPELEKVNVDSIGLSLNNSGSATPLASDSWSYDRSTYTLKILKTVSGVVSAIGQPVLTYTYEKEQSVISGKKLLYNNHYIYARMYDVMNLNGDGPMQNVIDENTGDILQIKSRISEWSKLSWYQDFEEVRIDELDGDVGESDLTDGMLWLPVETPGLNGDTRIRFWVNTNNDRMALVVMGNPSLDFGRNRHLISAAYLGQIESFENSINDTAGNFALFTSSSTTPCAASTAKKRITMSESAPIAMGTGETTEFSYTLPEDGKLYDVLGSFRVTHEDLQTGIISELLNGTGCIVSISADKKTATVTLFSAPSETVQLTLNYDYYTERYETVKGITRDGFGNVIDIVLPDTYGKNTATGVVDISMLHTRSKAYFQKHHLMFTSTEEYMSKEQYGKSAYTGEYYADKLKITHGNDGPRGVLADCLAIDTSSLYAFDELIVNRDFKKDATKEEETYIFFPITAPFSPFAGSPNATYGFAIKKAVRRPEATTDEDAVDEAIDGLGVLVGNLYSLTSDVVLPAASTNGLAVDWSSSSEELILITEA